MHHTSGAEGVQGCPVAAVTPAVLTVHAANAHSHRFHGRFVVTSSGLMGRRGIEHGIGLHVGRGEADVDRAQHRIANTNQHEVNMNARAPWGGARNP